MRFAANVFSSSSPVTTAVATAVASVLLLLFVSLRGEQSSGVVVVNAFTFSSSSSSSTKNRKHAAARIVGMTQAAVNTASAGTATNEDAQQQQRQQHHGYLPTRRQSAASLFGRMAGLAVAVAAAAPVAVVHADEIGREVEMTLDVTGEALMICTKRGPLGACTKTVYRTAENDNDKAATYMGKPSELVSQKDREARRSSSEEDAGNALIEKLKQRSEDNSEKNARVVEQRTQLNDAVRVPVLVSTSEDERRVHPSYRLCYIQFFWCCCLNKSIFCFLFSCDGSGHVNYSA